MFKKRFPLSLFIKGLAFGVLMGNYLQQFFMPLDTRLAMACVALSMAILWIFEVLPLGITALLPLVAYPLLGIMSTKDIAPTYMSSVLFLFIGGFFVALAMQKWGLHRRLALTIISFFGGRPEKLILGLMVATSSLSMWISNTATAVMMVSIGMALIKNYEDIQGRDQNSRGLAALILLSIAYSATIGGIATLVGTPPNLAFVRIYSLSFPNASEISFGQWLSFGLPTTLLMLAYTWYVITKIFLPRYQIQELNQKFIKDELKKLGPMCREEKWVAFIFTSMAFLWIFRADINLGFFTLPGWSQFLPHGDKISDSTVAILMAMFLFIIPAIDPQTQKKTKLLNAKSINDIPWSTILLFGGGFALAKGMSASGLSDWIGPHFLGLQHTHPYLVVSLISLGMSFLTELTSNMASTEMLLPIMASIAKTTGLDPKILMIPTTLAASCAFMLPAATAPNAIIFAAKRIKIKEMIHVGIWINLGSILIISLISYFIVPLVLN